MEKTKRLGLTVLLVLGCALIAQGSPVQLKDVPADAKWLAHVDVDAAHASKVVQTFFDELGKDLPELHERIGDFCKHIGLEDCKDLHAITAYGVRFEPHHGVVIVRAKWNKEALSKKVEKAPDHKSVEYGKYRIHTFTAHKRTKHAHEVAAVLYQPDVLVVASSVDLLKSALDVLDGKAANISGKDSRLAVKPQEGAIFLARAIELNRAETVRHCPVLQLIDQFSYEEGQQGSQWFGKLAVTAESQPVADDLKKVADGFWALVALHFQDQPKLLEMLQHVKVSVDAKTVSMTFQEPVDDLAAQAPATSKLVAQHIKMHMKMMHEHMMPRKEHECGKDHAMCPMMGMMQQMKCKMQAVHGKLHDLEEKIEALEGKMHATEAGKSEATKK